MYQPGPIRRLLATVAVAVPIAVAAAPGGNEVPATSIPASVRSPTTETSLVSLGRGTTRQFVAVTFNAGSRPGMDHDAPPPDGYSARQAAVSDRWYGNGLAWRPFIDATRRWFARVDADVVVFQEIFHPGDCEHIPARARRGFVCETWQPGDPTVAQMVLGEGWQVACHPGRPDKCAAVHRRFGVFRACDADLCLDGLEGFPTPGCGHGARIARGVIEHVDGGELTLVSVHASSGIRHRDQQCRLRQIEQIFVDFGDGRPAANAAPALVLGDLNTDPGRVAHRDPSAQRWREIVAATDGFRFLTALGEDTPAGFYGLLSIDHVLGAGLGGECFIAGVETRVPAVMRARFFDHAPVVCALRLQSSDY